MKYHCSNCDYIYDELVGDEDLGIDPGVAFEELSVEFFCPFCDTHKDDFVVLGEEVYIPLDFGHLTSREKTHFPNWSVEGDQLHFDFGEDIHPSEVEHFIYSVALYEDGERIESLKFTHEDCVQGSFDIEYLDVFEVRIYCNQEGVFSTGEQEREFFE